MSPNPNRLTLRVKPESELDRVIRVALSGPHNLEELDASSGSKRAKWLLKQSAIWFENVAVDAPWGADEYSAIYTDLAPTVVQNISNDAPSAPVSEKDFTIQWPEAPPIPTGLDNFDKPSWYDVFSKMVQAGKHYSFEGPPGVGKDTAVIQLAAELGKPLATLNGDGGFRRRDLTGGFADVGLFLAGDYVNAAINGYWVLLTEVNAADADALMYINAQLAAPYVVTLNGRSFPVHPDFRVFVSYNHGLVGTKPLPQSFKDRFASVKVPFFTTIGKLQKRMVAMGMPSYKGTPIYELGEDLASYKFMETVLRFGMAMWDAHERGQMRYQITTRRLMFAVDLYLQADVTDVKQALKMAVIEAIDSPIEAKAAENVLRIILTENQ